MADECNGTTKEQWDRVAELLRGMGPHMKPRESHRAIWLDLSQQKPKQMKVNKVRANVAIGIKMIEYFPLTKAEYNAYRGWDMPEGEDPNEEGYCVEYLDSDKSNHPNHKGYISWSPKNVFDKAYLPIATAHTITKEDVEKFIGEKPKVIKLDEKTALSSAETRTGFVTHETSSCVDPANFSLEIGGNIATERIVDKIWGHLGFVLQWAKNGLK